MCTNTPEESSCVGTRAVCPRPRQPRELWISRSVPILYVRIRNNNIITRFRVNTHAHARATGIPSTEKTPGGVQNVRFVHGLHVIRRSHCRVSVLFGIQVTGRRFMFFHSRFIECHAVLYFCDVVIFNIMSSPAYYPSYARILRSNFPISQFPIPCTYTLRIGRLTDQKSLKWPVLVFFIDLMLFRYSHYLDLRTRDLNHRYHAVHQ